MRRAQGLLGLGSEQDNIICRSHHIFLYLVFHIVDIEVLLHRLEGHLLGAFLLSLPAITRQLGQCLHELGVHGVGAQAQRAHAGVGAGASLGALAGVGARYRWYRAPAPWGNDLLWRTLRSEAALPWRLY